MKENNFKEVFVESIEDFISKEIYNLLKKKVSKDSVYFYDNRLMKDDDGIQSFEADVRRAGNILIFYKEGRPANGEKVYKYNYSYLD